MGCPAFRRGVEAVRHESNAGGWVDGVGPGENAAGKP